MFQPAHSGCPCKDLPMHPVHSRCSSRSRPIPFCTFQLDDKTLCREIRSQVNVEENTVFLLRIALETKNLEFFESSVPGTLYAIQKLADLTTQIPFRLVVPVLKGTAVEEIHQHFRYPIEHTDYGIGLQSQVVPLNNVLAEKAITLPYSFTIGIRPIFSISEISLFFRLKATPSTSLMEPYFLPAVTCAITVLYTLPANAAEGGISKSSVSPIPHRVPVLPDSCRSYIRWTCTHHLPTGWNREQFDDIVRFFQISEIRVNHHLVVMRNLCPFFNNLVGTQISGITSRESLVRKSKRS